MKPVHPLIQQARGLCTDGAPHEEIEALLARAVDAAKDLEEVTDTMARGIASLFDSLPYSAPENVAFLAQAKLRIGLEDYRSLNGAA